MSFYKQFYIIYFILKMEYTMTDAYIGKYHTKPLTEQQLKVTCTNEHVGHAL
jgi:hypothetical protein